LLWLFGAGPAGALSWTSQALLLLTLCYGHTMALFSNSFFAHTLIGVLNAASLYFFVRRFYFAAGLTASFAMLSDYSAAPWLGLLALAFLLLPDHRHWRSMASFGLGILPAAVLWALYHHLAFGNVFATSLAFQNPEHLTSGAAVGGIFSMFPSLSTLVALIFGPERGILMTQPWFLVLVATSFFVVSKQREARFFWTASLLYFLLLLLLNASFNGWHGGGSPGPRYLSAALFLFVLANLNVWELLVSRRLFRALLFFSLVFFCAVWSTTILLHADALWPQLFGHLVERPSRWVKFACLLLLNFLALLYAFKKERRLS
jgi:hypothetical protein